jgi:putative transposase
VTVVDDCTQECPAIEVDTSLGGLRVRRVLDQIASERGLPEAIVLDNGPEFRGRALAAWSEERVCVWNLFSRASRHRTLLPRASTAGYETNV